MTSLWRETYEPLIDLSKGNYSEKDYTKEQITKAFTNACLDLLPIFEDYNKTYSKEAKLQVEQNLVPFEKEYFSWLKNDAKFVIDVLKNPLDKTNYQTIAELNNSYLYIYGNHDLRFFDEDGQKSFIDSVKKTEELFFKDVCSFNLLKYGKFLSVFISNLYCYLCFYQENLNKKYYYRFEHLIRDTYGYWYFKQQQNPHLLITDQSLISLKEKYCKDLDCN